MPRKSKKSKKFFLVPNFKNSIFSWPQDFWRLTLDKYGKTPHWQLDFVHLGQILYQGKNLQAETRAAQYQIDPLRV